MGLPTESKVMLALGIVPHVRVIFDWKAFLEDSSSRIVSAHFDSERACDFFGTDLRGQQCAIVEFNRDGARPLSVTELCQSQVFLSTGRFSDLVERILRFLYGELTSLLLLADVRWSSSE
jgi:hypothetical protein